MVKNGLFFLSIGCLLLIFSGNARTGKYNILSMTTAFFLIVIGTFLIFREKKQNKKTR